MAEPLRLDPYQSVVGISWGGDVNFGHVQVIVGFVVDPPIAAYEFSGGRGAGNTPPNVVNYFIKQSDFGQSFTASISGDANNGSGQLQVNAYNRDGELVGQANAIPVGSEFPQSLSASLTVNVSSTGEVTAG